MYGCEFISFGRVWFVSVVCVCVLCIYVCCLCFVCACVCYVYGVSLNFPFVCNGCFNILGVWCVYGFVLC